MQNNERKSVLYQIFNGISDLFTFEESDQCNIIVDLTFEDIYFETQDEYKKLPTLSDIPKPKHGTKKALIVAFYGNYCALQEYKTLKHDIIYLEDMLNVSTYDYATSKEAKEAIKEKKERCEFLESKYKLKGVTDEAAEYIILKKDEMARDIVKSIKDTMEVDTSKKDYKVKLKIDGHGANKVMLVGNSNPKNFKIVDIRDIKDVIADVIKQVKTQNPEVKFELTLLSCEAAATKAHSHSASQVKRVSISDMKKYPYHGSVASQVIRGLSDVSKLKASDGINHSNNSTKLNTENKVIAERLNR